MISFNFLSIWFFSLRWSNKAAGLIPSPPPLRRRPPPTPASSAGAEPSPRHTTQWLSPFPPSCVIFSSYLSFLYIFKTPTYLHTFRKSWSPMVSCPPAWARCVGFQWYVGLPFLYPPIWTQPTSLGGDLKLLVAPKTPPPFPPTRYALPAFPRVRAPPEDLQVGLHYLDSTGRAYFESLFAPLWGEKCFR